VLAFALLTWTFLRSTWSLVRDPKVRPLAVWLVVLLVGGTLFYRNVEGWSWLDSYYFCVMTLATVGYGDFAPVTALGKLFTTLYVFGGIGVLLAVANATIERSTTRVERRLRGKGSAAAKESESRTDQAEDNSARD
jgi:voltage-gated potassium channel